MTSDSQKFSIFLVLFILFLSNCAKDTLSPTNVIENSYGRVKVKITLSKIASIGKRNIQLSKLYLTLSAPEETPIYDTIEITGSEQIVIPLTYSNLTSLKTWSLFARSKDNLGNIIHSRAVSFDIKPYQTITVDLNLFSKYSMLKAHYYPIPDSVTKIELFLDDTLRADSCFMKSNLVSDTVTLDYDYIATDTMGISHIIKLNVYGNLYGENKLLYTGDTTIVIISGNYKNYSIYLHWVGSDVPPLGKANLLVTLGEIGVININGKILCPVKKFAIGTAHSLIIKTDNTLWGAGWNVFGQLGDGTTDTAKIIPVQVMTDVMEVSGGRRHSQILKTDKTLWATGRNNFGQLGDGTNTDRNTPVQIMADVRDISVGSSYSLMLRTDNTLWATGRNDYGQLCDGTNSARNTPVQVMTNTLDMEAGYEHTLILKTDHTLWVAGRNKQGQLGDGTNISKNVPVQVMTDVLDIVCGAHHSLVLKTDNTLWTTGENWDGQLGDGTNVKRNTFEQVLTNVINIGAGNNYSFAIKTDNSLWAMGWNGVGQLGDGTVIAKNIPVQVMTNVLYVIGGADHSLILETDNTLWATGSNYYGQLITGTTISTCIPVPVINP